MTIGGRWPAAYATALVAAVAWHCGSGGGVLSVADRHFTDGQFEQALAAYQAQVEAGTATPQTYLRMAECHRQLHDYNRAAAVYQALMREYPDLTEARTGSRAARSEEADWQMDRGEYRSAVVTLEDLIGDYPGDAALRHRLGQAYGALGLTEKARTSLEAAAALDPAVPGLAAALGDLTRAADAAGQWYAAGLEAFNHARYDSAAVWMARVVELRPDRADARYYRHLAQGITAFTRGEPALYWQSIEAFGLAMSADPQAGAPHYWMGRAYEKLGADQFDNSVRAYEQAIALDSAGDAGVQAAARLKAMQVERAKLDAFWGRKKEQ